MALFVAQIKGATAMGRTDINRVSETVLVPLFSEVFGYRALKNLNYAERENYPGIDLGDNSARVAFQITATSDSEKVKDTLRKFVRYRLYEAYDQLFVYILTERQNSYSGKAFAEILEGKFSFDVSKHILDYRNVLRKIGEFQIEKALAVCNVLEQNLSSVRQVVEPVEDPTRSFGIETVSLNLIEVSFPSTLCIGDLSADRRTKVEKRRSTGIRNERDRVRDELLKRGLRFGTDWETAGRRLMTFHDLSDSAVPLSQLVEPGTVLFVPSLKFYSRDENSERVFKSLLRRCLQQKLYHQGLRWQNDKNVFIFVDKNGEDIREEQWIGDKSNERVVFERTRKTNRPDETWYCKHLAFASRFHRIDERWFLAIKPDWFFSKDGYKEYSYADEKVDWLKRKENNQHLYNQFRFIHYFLTYNEPPDLFENRKRYPYLTFGNAVIFESYPALDDELWNPPKSGEEDTGLSGDTCSQMNLFDL